MSFSSLGLSEPILRTLEDLDYFVPTPIQIKAIPAILSGRDVMAAAQTGTGKTAGFALPLLQRLAEGPKVRSNHIRALVLTPTRELAVQVSESVATYSKYLQLKSGVVYGGVKINPQMMKLRGGLDLLVATPGRLLDLFSQNAVKFGQVEALVLDEADRMLDLGFSADISKILAMLPKQRQNLLFSASFSEDIRNLTKSLLKSPLQIDVSPRNSAAKSVLQSVYEVDKGKKSALLSHLVRNKGWEQVLVFTRTKNGADNLVKKLQCDDLSAAAIHGDKSQNERSRALDAFKQNQTRVLVATDVAARGLDISELPHVVNFDLPKVVENYVHRIGRTGRAGLQGEAISLVSADEVKLLAAIEAVIKQTLTRETETGFVPTHSVPMSRDIKVKKKKPKKPKQKPEQSEQTIPVDDPNSPHKKPRKTGKPQETIGGRGRRGRDSGALAGTKRSSPNPKRDASGKNKTRRP